MCTVQATTDKRCLILSMFQCDYVAKQTTHCSVNSPPFCVTQTIKISASLSEPVDTKKYKSKNQIANLI